MAVALLYLSLLAVCAAAAVWISVAEWRAQEHQLMKPAERWTEMMSPSYESDSLTHTPGDPA
jgi:type II secretory pathway component PulK